MNQSVFVWGCESAGLFSLHCVRWNALLIAKIVSSQLRVHLPRSACRLPSTRQCISNSAEWFDQTIFDRLLEPYNTLHCRAIVQTKHKPWKSSPHSIYNDLPHTVTNVWTKSNQQSRLANVKAGMLRLGVLRLDLSLYLAKLGLRRHKDSGCSCHTWYILPCSTSLSLTHKRFYSELK
jgi:hypothetical protein